MNISRERLENLLKAIDSEAYDEEEIAGWVNSDEIFEMARALLAVMDARENSTIKKRKALLWLERQQLANPCMKEVRYAIEIIANPPAHSAPEWSNEQCLEFLSVAFRHAKISGDIQMDDIRLALKIVYSAAPGGE